MQDAGEPFFFNAAFPHENFSSGENWNHYSPLLCALFIVDDICIRYKRFPARLATIATRKQRSKPAQNGLLFFAAKPPKTKKRPLRQQKKLHFDFSKCSFPFGATGRIRTGDLLITKSVQTPKSLCSSPFTVFPLGGSRTSLRLSPHLLTPFFLLWVGMWVRNPLRKVHFSNA